MSKATPKPAKATGQASLFAFMKPKPKDVESPGDSTSAGNKRPAPVDTAPSSKKHASVIGSASSASDASPATDTTAKEPLPSRIETMDAEATPLQAPSGLSRTGVPLSTPQRAASMHLSGSGQRASSGGSTGSSERPSHAPSGRSGSGRLSFGSSAHGGAPPRSMSFSGAARSLSRSLSLTSRRDRDRARSDTVRATAALLSNYAVDDGGIASPSSGASPGA